MKPILHIIKGQADREVYGIIKRQTEDNAYGITVVYINDTGDHPDIPGARVCFLRQKESGEKEGYITYDDLLDLILSSESITVW